MKNTNPIISFTYFAMMICFSCIFMHPIYLIISLMSGLSYCAILKDVRSAIMSIVYMLPMIIIMSIFNPLFNHEGITVIAYLPNGNPITAESLIYGIAAVVMLASVILWFACLGEVITSDKFMYVFGRIIPTMSLVLSMTLRFVPRFIRELRTVLNAQKCIGRGINHGSILTRVKNCGAVMSVMLTWSLENAIATSDSMKSRGYGTHKRTSFAIYRFFGRDIIMLVCILMLCGYIITGAVFGATHFAYYPALSQSGFSWYNVSVMTLYFILAFTPHMIEIKEFVKWQVIKSKI